MDLNIGDIIQTKKNHPCGSNQWKIQRVGADIRIECLGCGHNVMLSRVKLEKSIKKVILHTSEEENNNG